MCTAWHDVGVVAAVVILAGAAAACDLSFRLPAVLCGVSVRLAGFCAVRLVYS